YALRSAQLAALAGYATQFKGPSIIAGDINVTPWSPLFESVKNRSGLRDSGLGFGYQPTWPTMLPFAIQRIPIDHVLISKHFHVSHRALGPAMGSDHFPLIVDLQLAAIASDPLDEPVKSSN